MGDWRTFDTFAAMATERKALQAAARPVVVHPYDALAFLLACVDLGIDVADQLPNALAAAEGWQERTGGPPS